MLIVCVTCAVWRESFLVIYIRTAVLLESFIGLLAPVSTFIVTLTCNLKTFQFAYKALHSFTRTNLHNFPCLWGVTTWDCRFSDGSSLINLLNSAYIGEAKQPLYRCITQEPLQQYKTQVCTLKEKDSFEDARVPFYKEKQASMFPVNDRY